jgi:hypothetical protein
MGVRFPPRVLCVAYAEVAKLADAPDLGSGVEKREGSSPSFRMLLGPVAKRLQHLSYIQAIYWFESSPAY